MIPVSVIVVVLGLLVCAACTTLWLDARQRRIERQVAVALPVSRAAGLPSIRRAETGSRSEILDRLVSYRPGIPYVLHPTYVVLIGIVAGAITFYAVGLLAISTGKVAVAAAFVAIMTIRGAFKWQQRRFTDRLFRQLPDTVQLVTSTVRSGLPVHEAFRTIAREMPQPTAGQFTIACSELNMGRPPEEVVEGIYRRTQVTEYGIFAVTLAVQLKSGGSLAETLQTLAETVRQRVAMAARAKALASEVIFSSRALVAAPFIVGGVIYSLNPEMIEVLFHDPTGNTMLAYAVVSVLIGHFVIRWMIRRNTAL